MARCFGIVVRARVCVLLYECLFYGNFSEIALPLLGKWYGAYSLQSFVGQLELYGSREAAQREIRQQRPVRYRVRFPTQSPLPSLKRVECNSRTICSGRGEYGGYITEIRLEHSFFTDLPAGVFGRRRQPQPGEQDFVFDPDGFNYPVNAFGPPANDQTTPRTVYTRPNSVQPIEHGLPAVDERPNEFGGEPAFRPTAVRPQPQPEYVPVPVPQPEYVPVPQPQPEYVPVPQPQPEYVPPPVTRPPTVQTPRPTRRRTTTSTTTTER